MLFAMPKDIWEHFYRTRGRFYLSPHEAFTKVVSVFKNLRVRKVLDLGCGSGRHSIALAKKGFLVSGIDFSVKAIDLAKKWMLAEDLQIDFRVGDFREGLAYGDETFDAVIAIDSIQYDTITALSNALSEISRVLKKDGVAFVTLPTIEATEMPHLVLDEVHVRKILGTFFEVKESFIDSEKFFCSICIKKKLTY